MAKWFKVDHHTSQTLEGMDVHTENVGYPVANVEETYTAYENNPENELLYSLTEAIEADLVKIIEF